MVTFGVSTLLADKEKQALKAGALTIDEQEHRKGTAPFLINYTGIGSRP